MAKVRVHRQSIGRDQTIIAANTINNFGAIAGEAVSEALRFGILWLALSSMIAPTVLPTFVLWRIVSWKLRLGWHWLLLPTVALGALIGLPMIYGVTTALSHVLRDMLLGL
jgi:hypothetical protein